ncbi:acyl-CoA synthetase [Laribacter hongkongensis]|uniref:acyl-CoA synthetase n=1 Tax=Laribacter hongkongensis TaxID=168471 RepID=UPI0018778A7F|nr:acyl-CoA synthetase [Laribacter hongkongensis]MBE5529878.1 acyl-CoA synthetase [Laribacter hongkongensis]MCG9052247.1 acyl-CoA synthetase [Laribacter hongkongensis]MCG9063785.1 acyl-CoA synthetase [Laribacter hongkongensis]MCG9080056.1 acyl-CoA synthetase [Laribacter hongkongensis]MCG9081619.1 acyl-CoA synthetase [Laribacter hongkongensis]
MAAAHLNPYEIGLDKNPANYVPLTPVTFLERAAQVYPNKPAVIHGQRVYTWSQVFERSRRLASALAKHGVRKGSTVAILCPNIPEMVEAHFGIPMQGAVLNTMNYRLDAATIAFQIDHGEAEVLLVDSEFASLAREALHKSGRRPLIVDIVDSEYDTGDRVGRITYEELLAEGDPGYEWPQVEDEWDAITLNYTSGTTGNPKGVVYHHRGAYLNALGNIVATNMTPDTVTLWSLPMFHCNGWCFNWSLAAVGGTSVCLRRVEAGLMFELIEKYKVNYMCGAAVVLSMFINAADEVRRPFPLPVRFIAAAAPVPVPIIRAAEAIGFRITHVYGLTETYGPATACIWKDEYNALSDDDQGDIRKRQGVRYHVQEAVSVLKSDTMEPVPADGQTLGEVMFRGNVVMKGYLKNPSATEQAFADGWFHTGDIGVLHPDGYIELKDRAKDIIISGGENIPTIEVEAVLYQHPSVLECAVVAKKDEKWGEIPCAYITLKFGAEEPSTMELMQFCRERLAHYKVPRLYVFGPLPKTSTGKIQKFVLRDQANQGQFVLN